MKDGFSDATIGGARWRVSALGSPAAACSCRWPSSTTSATSSRPPSRATSSCRSPSPCPSSASSSGSAVGRATQSLTHVNQQVASRAADNLTPLDVADAPSEIGALVRSLNQLFGRVQGLIEQERRFTADAAHELRTPLAGIRAQAQVALGATGDAEDARALDGVIAGCDRATHTVEQMLTLARLAPDAVSFQPTPVELAAVLKGDDQRFGAPPHSRRGWTSS